MIKQKLLALILISLTPQSINNYVVRHQEGLSIHVSKKSPPLAIFEDEQLTPKIINQIGPTFAAAIPLRTGTIDLTKRALEIASRFVVDDIQIPPIVKAVVEPQPQVVETVLEKSVVQLTGMRIQKNNPNVKSLIKSLPKETIKVPEPQTIQEETRQDAPEVAEYTYRPNPGKSTTEQFEDIKRHYLQQEFLAGLPPVQRDRLEGIKNLDKVLSSDWSQPTFDEQAKQVLANNNAAPPPEETQPDTGLPTPTYTQQSPAPTATGLLAEPQLLISGPLEMADGLAYLGNNQYIKVYRQAGTALLEEGNVVIQDGRYEILVRNPQDGVVIAELRTIDQQILGRGEILLNEVIRSKKSREDLQNISIKIKPLTSETQTITVSGYSFDDEQKIEGARVSVNGFMDIGQTDKSGKNKAQVLADSNMIIRADKKGYWGSMLFKTAGQVFKHTLFGDETVQSWFEQLNLSSSRLKKTGIIWGEVKIGAAAVSDVEVEVVSSEFALQPTYFVGGVIPDASLRSTTANGRFAFFDLDPGIYIVRAKYKGKNFPPQVVVVDRGYVSTVALQWQEKSPSEVYVFDIETSEPAPSEIKFIGSDKKAFSKTGKHIVNFSGKEGVQVIEANTESNNHYISRATVDKAQKQVMIPIISYDWISRVLSRVRLNQNFDRGIIVGIARKSDMRIELDPLGYDSETEIIYFDARGEVLAGATNAPIGGGFIIFNAVPGVRTILMTYKGIKQTQIHTALSDPDVINVFNPNY